MGVGACGIIDVAGVLGSTDYNLWLVKRAFLMALRGGMVWYGMGWGDMLRAGLGGSLLAAYGVSIIQHEIYD